MFFDKVANFLASTDISKLLVAPACLHVASDWPRTFFTPKVFLFSLYLHESNLLGQLYQECVSKEIKAANTFKHCGVLI